MDLVALGIFLLTFLLCSVLVFFISVYGTKEVTFEENLKATQKEAKKKAPGQPLDAKKKAKSKAGAVAKTDDVLQPAKPAEDEKRSETPEMVEAAVPEAIPMTTTDEEPKSSAEPTPKKVKKAKQNKIKIEEVEPEVALEEPQPQVEVVEAEEKRAKKSKPSKAKSRLDGADGPVDLYGMVMKSTLDDLEIQRVIDLLLTKQTGSNGFQHDWVEASEKNETKNLQRQLTEKDALLAEEMAKVKSILEKMNALRQELNSTKTAAVQSQRYMNDLEVQRKHLEQRLQHEVDNNRSIVATLQGQIQYHAQRAQGLQATLDSVQQQQAHVDPAIYNELESLRALKTALEANNNGLHGQLSQHQEEITQLQQKLSKKASDLEEARNSLKSAMDSNNKMNEQLAGFEKKSTSEKEQVEGLKHVNADLEAKVKELTSMCMKQKSELTRLTEENERISDQLAAYVERPTTEGQESNGISNENGHHKGKEEELWHKKYLDISQQHELILKEKDVIMQQMHSAESHYKSQVAKLEADLEDQRAKNNDNAKEVEVLRDAEQSQKAFLQRLFPDVAEKVVKAKKHNDWLEEFASCLSKTKPVEPDEDQLKKLEGQINHYKSVLAETENMLNQLQASVESEESSWKCKIANKEAQLEKIQRELEAVEAKNAAMEASINSLNSVEEMESKLRELQDKLAVEEADKLQLQNQLSQSLDTDELSKLREQLESETKIRADMDAKVAKMSQLLATGQEALQQEQKTVEMLRQQLATKANVLGTVNGGSDEAAVTE